MAMRIIDGAAHFGAGLEEVYRHHPLFAGLARRAGVTVPPLHEQSPATTATFAYISHNRLICDCPDCRGAVYVWREGPHLMLCPDCWNGAIGGLWRPVMVPDKLAEIEAILLARPLPQHRNWKLPETLDDLRRQDKENLQ